MFFRLLFLLTVIPFLEIYFLIRISDSIGFVNTLWIVFFTGILGAALLRKQGHSILMEMQAQGAQNQLPTEAIAKGFLTFVGGVLLLTPGILTDGIGLSLIFPLTQLLWRKYFMGRWKEGLASGNIKFYGSPGFRTPPQDNSFGQDPFTQQSNQRNSRFDNVIDVEASKSQTVDKKD